MHSKYLHARASPQELYIENLVSRLECTMSSCSNFHTPCAACKFLRRKCLPSCLFAPYFPPEEPLKFINVHKIFGASNVTKLLNEIQPHQREDAVNSLAYEAQARLKDPVYGCTGAISLLQQQVTHLQKELDATNAELMLFGSNENPQNFPVRTVSADYSLEKQTTSSMFGVGRTDETAASSFDQLMDYRSPPPWNC